MLLTRPFPAPNTAEEGEVAPNGIDVMVAVLNVVDKSCVAKTAPAFAEGPGAPVEPNRATDREDAAAVAATRRAARGFSPAAVGVGAGTLPGIDVDASAGEDIAVDVAAGRLTACRTGDGAGVISAGSEAGESSAVSVVVEGDGRMGALAVVPGSATSSD